MVESTQAASRPLELTELLNLLFEGADHIASTLDLDELMVRIAEVVKRAVDYEVFAILLLKEKTQELRVRFSVGHPEEVVRSLRIKVGDGIVGRAVAQRRSVLVNDVRQDPAYIQSLAEVRSELAVPLIVKNRVIGVIDLEAPAPDFFTERHQTLLELLGGRMALAIENARLYRRSVRQANMLQLLYDISRELSSVLVLNELLRKIGELTKRLIDYHRFSILLANEQTRTFETVISITRGTETLESVTVPFGRGIVGAAAEARRAVNVPDVRRDPRYISIIPQTRSELAVPLIHRDRVIGVLDLESPQPAHFTEGHARLFTTLAPQLAIALENARLYEQVVRSESRLDRDLQRARDIQRHLLPALGPTIPRLETCAHFQPARELGGDLYDFLAYGKDRHVLLVGDVSGKGAPAALYGAMVSGILRSLAPQRLPSPELMRKLNVMLRERQVEGHFITLIYSVWHPRTRTLRLSNAGMPQPILVRSGRPQTVRAEGVPLGLLDGMEYQETSVSLRRGDLLAMFSDGVIEATNPAREEFGVQRLEKLLAENARRPLGKICETIEAEIERFEQGRHRSDDQTYLLIRVR